MNNFETYAFLRAYVNFLETEVKLRDRKIGELQSDIDELKHIPENERSDIAQELEAERERTKDLLFKNNQFTTKALHRQETEPTLLSYIKFTG